MDLDKLEQLLETYRSQRTERGIIEHGQNFIAYLLPCTDTLISVARRVDQVTGRLEDCRQYAAWNRHEDWAKAILRFCAEAGEIGPLLRGADEPDTPIVAPTFASELASLIDRYGSEDRSETPDFILAQLLQDALNSWKESMARRAAWLKCKVAENGAPG